MFLGAIVGYGFYYTCRLPLSVTKSQLVGAGVLDTAQLGRIGSAHKIAYAVGKLVNGFLADRVHLGRFLMIGLFLSALLNLGFGQGSSYGLFLTLWIANGWFQAHGAPTCGVILSNWFGDAERGHRYAVWSLSHHLGEALTFSLTAWLVDRAGWRAGFLGPGIASLAIALMLTRWLADRPVGLGLPPVQLPTAPTASSEASDDAKLDSAPSAKAKSHVSTWQLQREVLSSGWVWLLALASASMYVTRYAISDWGVLYLEKEKGYSLTEAGLVISLFPIIGALGSASSGYLSDRFFNARRTPLTVAAAALLLVAQSALYLTPPGHPWVVRTAISLSGIATGALLVFLGGLTALDITPTRASGAALGLVGNCSYLGAAAQDWLSGALIRAGRHRDATGTLRYDFQRVKGLWIGASVLTLLLSGLLWWPERRLRERARAANRAAERDRKG